jgi:hypothetical protein
MRLCTYAKYDMTIDLWEEKHQEYCKQAMVAKDWNELVNKISVD